MDRKRPEWMNELAQELQDLAGVYTTDRYPKNIETQRHYEQALVLLETKYAGKVKEAERNQLATYDEAFQYFKLKGLDDEERTIWPHVRDDNELWEIRANQKREREDLSGAVPDPAYRKTDEYREGQQQLVDRQRGERESMDQAFRNIENGLNERFGFIPERDRNRGGRER